MDIAFEMKSSIIDESSEAILKRHFLIQKSLLVICTILQSKKFSLRNLLVNATSRKVTFLLKYLRVNHLTKSNSALRKIKIIIKIFVSFFTHMFKHIKIALLNPLDIFSLLYFPLPSLGK